jgi:hypothetical protein
VFSRVYLGAALVVAILASGCSQPAPPAPAPVATPPAISSAEITGPTRVSFRRNGEPATEKVVQTSPRQFGPNPYRDMDQGIHVPDDIK